MEVLAVVGLILPAALDIVPPSFLSQRRGSDC
jgi:hypothetical protein